MGKRPACLVAAVGSLLAISGTGVAAPLQLRSFDRFELDPVTAQGLWAEVATTDTHNHSAGGATAEAITVEPRLVYGGSLAEGGLFIPYHRVSTERSTFFGTVSNDEDGIGDVRLYGKLLPLQTEWGDAALGMELSFPSGDDTKRLGTGEVGFLPFGSTAVHFGAADLRAHFGYQAYAGPNRTVTGFEEAADAYVYGGGLFVGVGEHLGLRAEVAGLTFDGVNNDADVVFFEPGFDVRFALDGVDLYVRPSGAVGLTNDSPDWGVGGSIAIAWNP
jgi:hypothetical protein